jgi:hypothetical protein
MRWGGGKDINGVVCRAGAQRAREIYLTQYLLNYSLREMSGLAGWPMVFGFTVNPVMTYSSRQWQRQ